MSMLKKLAAAFAAMFAAASLMTAYAADPVIEQAKAQGVIGESYTGYLEVVDAGKASADLKRHVDEVNAGRLQAYTDIAKKNGQTPQVVGNLMAQKQFERASTGELVKPEGQAWTKKQ
ncbi:MAG TPA: YdbL family protein [Hyphomonadaceae bacterium]|nr:YdbL family protein [Hyphomonadaceae bacterium]